MTLTVPTALVRMTYSASPMLGLTPAVWITEATVPSPDAVSSSPSTACRSVTSQLTALKVIPRPSSVLAGLVEAVLTDVAEDDGVVSPDDLRRGKTHPACATGDHRH